MKSPLSLLPLVVLLAGCAARPVEPASPVDWEGYERARAAALVFDPPVALHEPPLELSRDLRRPGVFVGYDEAITTFSYVRVDDRQSTDFRDRFQRRSIIETEYIRRR